MLKSLDKEINIHNGFTCRVVSRRHGSGGIASEEIASLTSGEDLGDGNLGSDLNTTGNGLAERLGLLGLVLGFVRELVTSGTLLDLEELQESNAEGGGRMGRGRKR